MRGGPITRRCKSCRRNLPLDHFDLTRYTAVCKACAEPWPGAALAMGRLYLALGKSIPRLARALGYTHATTATYLYGSGNMCLRTTHHIRVVYEELRAESNGLVLADSADELAHKARYRAQRSGRG